ncbi:MAG TPA: 4-hydroxy-tetrahydrodipicolinate synthase [Flavobacteriaceae bacterium]|jgi:4-hydroxy-tetrahydrodipicolinate synthase|nr:4-hydroxy-tetrahydrodipicolinate synthase [Flavobacteriaceae bacterium]HBS12592.1 4-hydroxy-tetrahydrodipicolinate synthase [Flavobacteriaceae bacterium]
MKQFYGTGVALVTPFKEDKSIDHNALKSLVNFQIDNGVDYLVVLGTTGEPATLTSEEKEQVKEAIVTVNNGRLPLVLGIGGNCTQSIIDEIKRTDLYAFDAILSVAPYYNKPTQEGFYQHFKAIAEVCPKPIILYNVPGRTAKNVIPETIFRLASDFSNIIGVKEAGNNVHQYLKLIKNKPEDFLIISGDDDLVLGVVLAGGAGVISVMGQALPKEFSKMIQLGLEGKAKQAYNIHYKLMDGIDLIFEENNPSGIKALLKKRAICEMYVRLPLVNATAELEDKISAFIDEY